MPAVAPENYCDSSLFHMVVTLRVSRYAYQHDDINDDDDDLMRDSSLRYILLFADPLKWACCKLPLQLILTKFSVGFFCLCGLSIIFIT